MELKSDNKILAYQWGNYLKAGGNELVELFDTYLNDYGNCDIKKVAETVKNLNSKFCPLSLINNRCYNAVFEFDSDIRNDSEYYINLYRFFNEDNDYISLTAMECFENYIKEINAEDYNDKNAFDEFCSGIEYYTLYLSALIPELFIPYFFCGNFNIVTYIASEFGINLPPIPSKADYKGRFYYYAELCDALHKFREANGFTIPEFWAFLYDYAPNCVGLMDYIQEELPKPRSAFLIGSNKDDLYINEKITFWQCAPETRAGDMIVMYLKSPDCKIGYIWQSVSAGFNDPLYWYYRCTYIKRIKEIDGFTIKELREDEKWGKIPIVRKNMQGVHGDEIPPSCFNYLLDKCNVNSVERISFVEPTTELSIENEHDVELKMVEPLLERLCWKKSDYITQMNIKLGSGKDRIIPDYVIKPVEIPRHETGKYIIEVKKSIKKKEQLNEALGQARSYARQLQSQICAVIAKEGVWCTSAIDDFNEIIFSATFEELNDVDNFNKLYKIIGNREAKRENTKRRLQQRESEYFMFMDD